VTGTDPVCVTDEPGEHLGHRGHAATALPGSGHPHAGSTDAEPRDPGGDAGRALTASPDTGRQPSRSHVPVP
jgi:hypothetical protein